MPTNEKVDNNNGDGTTSKNSVSTKGNEVVTDAMAIVSTLLSDNNKEENNLASKNEGPSLVDAASEDVNALDAASTTANASASAAVTSTDEVELTASFPQKLMEILSIEEYHDIIRWLPHGKGFIIADKKRFADEVLPKHFKQAKFTSFTRKLNRWNFIRVTRGSEVGSYHHPSFQKDQSKLVPKMTCIGSKQSQSLKPLDPIALGIVPMGEEAEMALSASGVHQWQPQDHERYRLFYQQHQWNYMMQVMQASSQAQGTAAASVPVKNEDPVAPLDSTVETVDDNDPTAQSADSEIPPAVEEA